MAKGVGKGGGRGEGKGEGKGEHRETLKMRMVCRRCTSQRRACATLSHCARGSTHAKRTRTTHPANEGIKCLFSLSLSLSPRPPQTHYTEMRAHSSTQCAWTGRAPR